MEGIIDILMVIEDYSHYDVRAKKWFMSKEEDYWIDQRRADAAFKG